MNVIDPLHQHAASRPDDCAVITPNMTLSWRQLDQLIWSTAFRLHAQGLREGDRVGMTMVHAELHLITSLALARLGVAQIALPASESQEKRLSLHEKLRLKLAIFDSHDLKWPVAQALVMERLETSTISSAQIAAITSANPAATWVILQSSGTTGEPKFSELSHTRAIQRFDASMTLVNYTRADKAWVSSRLDFFIAKYQMLSALRAGASICVPVGIPMSHALVSYLISHQLTVAGGIPSLLHQLLEIGTPIPSLRALLITSAIVPAALRKAFRQKISPNLQVLYATNETGTLTVAPASEPALDDSVGRPLPTVSVEIVNSLDQLNPPEVPGQIRVRCPGMVDQYMDNASASARFFKYGWFYPGDLGYLTHDGVLVYLGRADDMMIFDGINIYPAEVEGALTSHPAVREAAAFGLNHERFQDVPAAAVILQNPATEAELIEHCKQLLGIKYPRKLFFIDAFPRNPMGKVLKRELKNWIADQDRSKR